MENLITCLIVDDEPLARRLLERFVDRVPSLKLVSSCNNSVDAVEALYETHPTLLFLDVQMPEVTGFDLLDTLTDNRPQVVLTTAYPQYAVEGYEYDVTDYLLKPIRFERFLRAINKVRALLNTGQSRTNQIPLPGSKGVLNGGAVPETARSEGSYIWLNVNKKQIHVNTQEVFFVESLKDYVKFHLSAQTVLVHSSLHKVEQLLPTNQFIRINRSYIIRHGAILSVQANMVELTNKQKLPIGICYRESVRGKLFPLS